ncbi:hypothetical protein MCHK_12365 (plasmid) [Mesorhizobium huakuii 7653R]|nr:hypothetical protein MCHK_12365 [Mesorhizobium huakuii 7653R]
MDAGGDRRIGSALAYLRKSHAGAKAIERERHVPVVADPKDAVLMEPRRVGEALSQYSASHEAGNWPKELAAAAHDQDDVRFELTDEPGPLSFPRPARSVRVRRKQQPLYPQDASLILGLEEALAKSNAAELTIKNNAQILRRFGRWLHANNKTSIGARLNSKSLSDGGEVLEFIGKGNPARLLTALGHLRSSQSTGGIVAIGRSKRNAPPGAVSLINCGDATSLAPSWVGDAAAQHSASHEAGSWPKLLRAAARDQTVGLELMDEPGPSSFLEHDQARYPGVSNHQRSRDDLMGVPPSSNNLMPSEEAFVGDEHDTAGLRPAKRQRKLNAPPAVAIQLQLNGIANSGGCMPMQPSAYQVGALPLEEQLVVRGRESEYIPRLQSEIRGIGGAAAQHSAPHDAIAPRFVVPMEDYDQDLLWEGMNKADSLPSLGSSASHCQPPASAGAVHALNRRHDRHPGADEFAGSSVLPRRKDGGFEAMVHRNPPTPFELNAMVPAPDFPPPFAGPVPAHHHGARQPGVPQELSPVPTSSNGKGLAWLSEELVRRQMQELASLLRAGAQHLYPGSEALVASDPSDLRDDAHFAPGPPPGARARSGTFDGLQSFVDLNAPTPSDLRDDAHFAPGPPPGARARSGTFDGLQSFVDLNAPTPSDLRDDAHSAPVRPRKQTLGDTERQTMMQGTEAAAVFGPGGPGDGPLMHRGRLSPMGEAAPATRAKIRQPASPVTTRPGDTYRGLPVVDLTTSTTTSSDTQLGASGPRASSNVAKGLVLGPDQWLADEHILRDYNLLHEQLQALDPMLAARTLLVDPSVSHLLRHRELQYARDILQSIYNRNAGPADFVFVPVNNGTLTREGSHWSLLLVDRRNPEMPVAYHYDSLQRAGHNNAPAKRLARVLNATSEPAPMAQQLNNHDCGVFVLDGTWELVRQLLDGQRPDHGPLPLDDLVADRPALQDRLRRRLPHE